MTAIDHELEFLLSLDGSEFRFGAGYMVRIAAARVVATKSRPHGIKYSLTLHDSASRRIYGLDNAHGTRRREAEYDHRRIYGQRKIRPYVYRGSAELLEDFYSEVARILKERGVSWITR